MQTDPITPQQIQALRYAAWKSGNRALMRQCDLVVATGSQANVRAAYASGTPAFGVGAGNVAGIVDETANLALVADRVRRSKTFDNATSCSSENSLVLLDSVYGAGVQALQEQGMVVVDDTGIQVTAQGWFLVRAVAMVFDRHLQADRMRAKFSKII
jgi:acyl-CoA reductase-like NAD-dependent aldehyde dehydrogenase